MWTRWSLTPVLNFATAFQEVNCRQYESEQVRVYSHKTLFMDTEVWISYNFHVSQNIALLLIVFQPFKSVKTILSLQAVQSDGPDLVYGTHFTDPWCRLHVEDLFLLIHGYIPHCFNGCLVFPFHECISIYIAIFLIDEHADYPQYFAITEYPWAYILRDMWVFLCSRILGLELPVHPSPFYLSLGNCPSVLFVWESVSVS